MWSAPCFRGQNPLAALVTLGGFAFCTSNPDQKQSAIAILSVMAGVLMLGESVIKIMSWGKQ